MNAVRPDPAGERPAYGVDAPGIMAGFLAGGGAAVVAGTAIARLTDRPLCWAGAMLAAAGAVPLTLGLLMTLYLLAGKRRTRNHMLGLVSWRGDESVLDVGTGAGLLMVGAAERAARGDIVGIDAWSAKDLSNNSDAATRRNLRIAGVEDRCTIVTGDARALPFRDGRFDAVVSLLCLHNTDGRPEQAKACGEIARVLKPGGRAVIGDYVPTGAYAAALAEAGLIVRRSRPVFGVALSLMWIVVADKPAQIGRPSPTS